MKKEYHLYNLETKQYIGSRIIKEPDYQLSAGIGKTEVPVAVAIRTGKKIGTFSEQDQKWYQSDPPVEEQVEPE